MPQHRSELLMPAGNLRKLKMAILYGADAVYLGTPDMSLRTKSQFSLEEVIEGIEFCHQHGKRAYLTLNLFPHNKDIPKLDEYIDTVRRVKPDGVIIADPGVFQYVMECAPELSLHVSTQSNICSWLSEKFWQDQSVDLCVLAREVSYSELVEVKNKLEAGEVLEFVSPIARETMLLRVYDFERADNGKHLDVVNGGTRTIIRLPFTLFDHEDIDDLRARFPVYSVMRKERALTDEQWKRVRFDKLTQDLEITGRNNPSAYARRRDDLVKSIGEGGDERRFKTNRIGTEGCCGKGCNGCLIFWQDDIYARARDILLKRKQGEQLSRAAATAFRMPAE